MSSWKEIADMNSSDPYWTAFTFAGEPDPNKLHVTHKYFGKLSFLQSCALLAIIESFFDVTDGFRKFNASFSRADLFGPEKNIRVLRPVHWSDFEEGYKENSCHELRDLIEHFRVDDYPSYSPHVTTSFGESAIHGVISGYVLMCGESIVKKWSTE